MNAETQEWYSELIEGLTSQGWAVEKGFLEAKEVSALREDAFARRERREFFPAGIGRAAARVERPDIRGDVTCWWEADRFCEAQRVFESKLNGYREAINRELYLGLRRTELHYAYYPPGTFYRRHVDSFKGSTNGRLISCVLYLNEQWTPADGGELVLYPEGKQPVRILPEEGLLVTFLSEVIPHEVLENQKGRWSVTGWMGKEAAY